MTRARVLLGLFVLLGCALYYSWQATPRQQRVQTQNTDTVQRRPAATAHETSNGVGLDFTGGEKLGFKKPSRDLFRPLYQQPKVVAKPPVFEPPPIAVEPPPMQVMPPPVLSRPVAMPAGRKPIPALKVVGYLEKGPRRTVFLSSLQGDIYLVSRGDRFADGLLVRDLDARQIVISRGQDDQGVQLPLGDAKSQRIPDVPIRTDRPDLPSMNELDPQKLAPDVPAPLPAPGENQIKVDP